MYWRDDTLINNIDVEYDRWLESQIEALKSHDFNSLDINNLIEELEALVRGEKSTVESLVYQILLHFLLIDYWHEESEWNRKHWRSEINNFQFQLNNKLTTNLTKHVIDRLEFIYIKARKGAELKTGLNDRFPEKLCYSWEKIIG
jgi:hypothetical protein